MKMRDILWTIGVFAVAVSLIVSGCAPPPAPDPTEVPEEPEVAEPTPTEAPEVVEPTPTEAPEVVEPTPAEVVDELAIAMIFDATTMDPHRSFEDVALLVQKAMYDQLTEVNPEDPSELEPLLAESWEISPDDLVYTFYLREGVQFATGNEMTAADVKFSLDRLQNLQDNPAFLMDGVEEVEVIDDYTVAVTLEAPDASFLAKTAAVYMAIMDSEVAQAQGCTSGPDAVETDACQPYLDAHSIGSGAYQLDRWVREVEIAMKPNEFYWRGEPGFDGVVVQRIEDVTTQAHMLERGDMDVALNIDPDRAEELEGTPGIVLRKGLAASIIYLAFNTRPEISEATATQELRQAVAWAIDYEGINEDLLVGYGTTPPGVLPFGYVGAETVPGFQQDVERATQLIADAGYADGVELELIYPNLAMFGIDFNVLAAKLVSDLAEIGISLELSPAEFAVWVTPYRGGETAFTIGYQTPDFQDSHANAWAFGASDGVFAVRMDYGDDETDQFVYDAIRVTDPAEREALYAQLLERMNEDAVFLPLVQPMEVIAYSDSIEGYRYDPVSKVRIAELIRR